MREVAASRNESSMFDLLRGEWLARPMPGAQNPLPCTQGRGQGEGTASRDIVRFASRCVRPLTPTLSTEYRGEGEAASTFGAAVIRELCTPVKCAREVRGSPEK